MSTVEPLFADQQKSIAFEEKSALVFDTSEPGTGKTRVRLEVFSKRRTRRGKCALVLGPKSALETAWLADCQKYTPWTKLVCAYAENRQKAFDTPADIYVTNHDAVNWLVKQPAAFFDRFDTLIVDESGAFKHHTSQRSKALNKIKKYFPRRVCMNGSPNTNTIADVWNQMYVLDDGQRLGQSFYAFRNAVCSGQQVGPNRNAMKWTDKPGSATVVADLIKDITLRNLLKGLPENREYPREFTMPARQRKAYEEMKKTAILVLKDKTVTAVNKASVITKLRQIASGAVYDGTGGYVLVDESRYDLVCDMLEAREFSVCFFLWKHQRDMIIKGLDARGVTHVTVDGDVTRKRVVEATKHFQGGFYRTMLAHPQSAAHALTWTKAKTTLWASPTYDADHWIQGNHRVFRTGQTEKTETVSVLAKNTIERHVYDQRGVKNAGVQELLAYLEDE